MPGKVDPLPASTAFPCRMVNKALSCRNDAKISRLHAVVSRISMGASRLHAPTSSSCLPMSDSWDVINDLWTAMSSLSLPISDSYVPINDSYAPINHFPEPPDCLRVSQNHSPVPASRPRRADFQRERRTRLPFHAVEADVRRLRIRNGA